jgi:pyridoxine 5'-phosphate synthase PdxJ
MIQVLSKHLEPERVVLLPDGDEDLWSEDYLDLVELA